MPSLKSPTPPTQHPQAKQSYTLAQLNPTHDASLSSWVSSAQQPGTDFPIQNLPFGRFRITSANGDVVGKGEGEGAVTAQNNQSNDLTNNRTNDWRIGIAIGDQILDLRQAAAAVAWPPAIARMLVPLAAGDLNAHMAEPSANRSAFRAAMSAALVSRR